MMGKYWSIVLLAGLGLAALFDARRAAYFRSVAPWVTIAAGALFFAPHAAWIVRSDFAPFSYALSSHPSTLASAALSGLGFVLGEAGYIAAPVIIALAAARPGLAALRDTVWPGEPPRRLVLIAFAAPLLLPVLLALVFKADIVSLWSMGAMTLTGIVLMSSPLVTLSRRAAVYLLAGAVVFPLAMMLASPVIAIVIHRDGVPNYATHYRLLAAEVEKAWHATSPKPLRYFGSYTNILNGVVFYLPDRPSTLDIVDSRSTPWSDPASVARAGIALACPEPEAICMFFLQQRIASELAAKRIEVTLSRTHLGVADAPVRYLIVIVPPKP
jgi:hypothetical protein